MREGTETSLEMTTLSASDVTGAHFMESYTTTAEAIIEKDRVTSVTLIDQLTTCI